MLFQTNLRKLEALPAAGLIAIAAITVGVLPLKGAETAVVAGDDEDSMSVRADRWFSAYGLLVSATVPEAPKSRSDCMADGAAAEAMEDSGDCPEWVALDDFEDVDYGGGIGITLCALDGTEMETVTGGFSFEAVLKKVFTLGTSSEVSRERTMCIYHGCGLEISEAEANHSVRT